MNKPVASPNTGICQIRQLRYSQRTWIGNSNGHIIISKSLPPPPPGEYCTFSRKRWEESLMNDPWWPGRGECPKRRSPASDGSAEARIYGYDVITIHRTARCALIGFVYRIVSFFMWVFIIMCILYVPALRRYRVATRVYLRIYARSYDY